MPVVCAAVWSFLAPWLHAQDAQFHDAPPSSVSTRHNLVAVVTGAARGIGCAIIVALAREGADIIGLDVCAPVDPRSGVEPSTQEDVDETGRLVRTAGPLALRHYRALVPCVNILRRKDFWRSIVNKNDISASLAGEVSLGGELSVNRLGFGAMRLTGEGIWGPPMDRTGAVAVLRRAVELDINFIDTADSYGPYVSEELIAETLFPYPRGLVIATKGGWNRPGPDQWTHDATPSHLRKAVEGSLWRLRRDCIDVYQLHIPDPVVSFDASVETLAELRNEGKIRLVALSNVTKEHIERARKIVPIVSVQNRYSFADREWDYVVRYCEQNGIAFIPWFPLGAGKVAGQVLNRIAGVHSASPTQIALAWLLRRSPIVLPIPGTSSIQHLEQNVAAASLRLTGEEFEELSEVSELVGSR